MVKNKKSSVFILFLFIFFVWATYRILFNFGEIIDVVFIKPFLWLVPMYIVLKKEGRAISSIGVTFKNLFPAIYLSLLLGAVFALEALVVNFTKYDGFNFNKLDGSLPFLLALILSFVTAVTEELVFRGYIFTRLWEKYNKEWIANLISSILWMSIHIPVVLFLWKLSFVYGVTYLSLVGIFGIGAAFIFAKTGNIFSSIFLHILWQWPIILFK